jgi:uncharacterized membrane protein
VADCIAWRVLSFAIISIFTFFVATIFVPLLVVLVFLFPHVGFESMLTTY